MIIYKVTNIENDMSYIGQTIKSLEDRKKVHAIKANHTGFYFHRALKKYGVDNFEWMIIKECNNQSELIHSEKFFIKQFNTKAPNGYNMTDGGEGTPNRIVRDETRLKLRIANLGKHPSKESCKKNSESHIGKPNSHKGRKFSKQWRENLSKAHKNYVMSEKQKKKISISITKWWEAHKGKKLPKEQREKISKSIKIWWDIRRGIV